MKWRKPTRLFLAVVMAIMLLWAMPISAWAAQDDVIGEVKTLLKTKYVEPVSEEVLNSSSIDEMLEKLDDRSTQYMTKEEYEQFLNTLDRSFAGIGIHLEMVPEGVLVIDTIEGLSSEEQGILAGDIITEADGVSLADKTSEFAVSQLRGTEGSIVEVKVKRGSKVLDFDLERRVIEFPLVEGEVLEDHIGYLGVYSFGLETVSQFDNEAKSLKEKGVDSWIIDLRNNGGGYTQAALELLGFLIGNEHAVILKDRSILAIVYSAVEQAYTLNQPMVLLVNNYTGSSSEIVTGAVKDHNKAAILGQTTFGSGKVKQLFPLSNGDYFKMTVNKFYSPDNHPIDGIGIKPHIEFFENNELEAAVLMLNSSGKVGEDKTGYLQVNTPAQNYVISLEDMKKPELWQAGQKLLDSVFVTTTLNVGSKQGWETLPENWLEQRYKIYYPDYVKAGDLAGIPLDKTFKVSFNKAMDWDTVSQDSIELINTATGERSECSFDFVDDKVMTVRANDLLKKDTNYWLVIHTDIKDTDGENIQGGIALAQTVK